GHARGGLRPGDRRSPLGPAWPGRLRQRRPAPRLHGRPSRRGDAGPLEPALPAHGRGWAVLGRLRPPRGPDRPAAGVRGLPGLYVRLARPGGSGVGGGPQAVGPRPVRGPLRGGGRTLHRLRRPPDHLLGDGARLERPAPRGGARTPRRRATLSSAPDVRPNRPRRG